jgi:hypothetical protein
LVISYMLEAKNPENFEEFEWECLEVLYLLGLIFLKKIILVKKCAEKMMSSVLLQSTWYIHKTWKWGQHLSTRIRNLWSETVMQSSIL